MTTILQEIISILTGGITGIASGIGGGLSELVQNIFIDGTGDTKKLSIFGGLVVVFAAVSLAIGLSRWIVSWVTSLGANH
jgi:hypothetical protein